MLSIAAVVVIGTIIGVANSGSPGPTSVTHFDYAHYFSAEANLEKSESVVLAEYTSEVDFARPIISPVTNEAVGYVDGVFRKYKILESFMGNGVVGESIYVASGHEVGLDRPQGPVTIESDSVSPKRGDSYVLFLVSRDTRETDPPMVGDTHWVHPGEPGIAQLVDGKLRFLATEPYWDAVESLGMLPAVPGSAAPFTMTLDELRDLKNRPAPVDTVATEIPDGE